MVGMMLMRGCAGAVLLTSVFPGCGVVEPENVELVAPPPQPCATASAQSATDDLGAQFSNSPVQAAERWARLGGGGTRPESGWTAYEQSNNTVWLAAGDWRVRADGDPDRGWLIYAWHRCG